MCTYGGHSKKNKIKEAGENDKEDRLDAAELQPRDLQDPQSKQVEGIKKPPFHEHATVLLRISSCIGAKQVIELEALQYDKERQRVVTLTREIDGRLWYESTLLSRS